MSVSFQGRKKMDKFCIQIRGIDNQFHEVEFGTNTDFPNVSDDMRERLITNLQVMIYAELAEEACRRWKLYKHQQKTGKPARVKIQHPFGDFIVGGNVL